MIMFMMMRKVNGYENANYFDEYDCEELVEHGIVEDDNDDEPRKRNLDDLKINCGRKGYVNPNSIIRAPFRCECYYMLRAIGNSTVWSAQCVWHRQCSLTYKFRL